MEDREEWKIFRVDSFEAFYDTVTSILDYTAIVVRLILSTRDQGPKSSNRNYSFIIHLTLQTV